MMDFIRYLRLLIIMSIVMMLSGCGDSDRAFDFGEVRGDTYINEYFGLSMKFPKGWHTQTKTQMDTLRARHAGADIPPVKPTKLSELSSATLLMICKYAGDTFFDFNPTLSIQIEKISPRSNTQTSRDYLRNAQKMLRRSTLQHEVEDSIHREVLGTEDFDLLHSTITSGSFPVYQDYYSALMHGFCFSFILTYAGEEGHQELKEIMSSAVFRHKK